jgi:isopenicillin-N N-acyltransferase-like protein
LRLGRWVKVALVAAATLLLTPVALHCVVGWVARLEPPQVSVEQLRVSESKGGLRTLGQSSVRRRGSILEARLVGDAANLGYAHARLLLPEIVEVEQSLYQGLRQRVPWWLARATLFDWAEWRFRNVEESMTDARRQELAGQALGFDPDPFADVFPTYQRLVYLSALYDIGLSFEHSSLVGCTTFVLPGTAGGHDVLLARAFDFEVDEVFDRNKVVFLVKETGQIPFASVAWAGLVGVVSGMNVEGVVVVAHGARAGRHDVRGEPVVHELRRLLSRARTLDDALVLLGERPPMASHILIVADANGNTAAVERVPRRADHVRHLRPPEVVTNHFEGPSASDPKNRRVIETTSTVARRRRGEALLGNLRPPASVADAVALLRDRRGANGEALPLGDRRAINALIAAHGIVADTRNRALWVSESPHLLGRFVRFDLPVLLADDYDPKSDPARPRTLPADPFRDAKAYVEWQAQHHAD